jgi:hypothetical protein
LNFFELAYAIVELHELAPIPQTLADASGMSRRRFYYLLKVGQFLREWDVSRVESEEIGWTKLQIVADHIERTGELDNEVVRNCLSVAKANTVRSLPKALAGQKSFETSAVVFHLNLAGKAILNEALLAFGAKQSHRGLVGKDQALNRLVWFAMEKGGHLD